MAGTTIKEKIASGARSGQAMRFLRQNGFTDVVNAGGLDDMPR
jgi:rhodanese-related sulfurtransferase